MEFQVDISFVKEQLETDRNCKSFVENVKNGKKVFLSVDPRGIIQA